MFQPGSNDVRRNSVRRASASSHFMSVPSNWSDKEVHNWLNKEKLGELCEALDGFDGSHLEEMYQDLIRNPEKFKDEMKSDYQMKGKICLKFSVALKKLFQQ